MPQVEMDTTNEYAQIQEFGNVLQDFLVPENKWSQQVPQRLLDEYGHQANVQYGYRTDIGWFVMVKSKSQRVCTISHIDYPGRVHP